MKEEEENIGRSRKSKHESLLFSQYDDSWCSKGLSGRGKNENISRGKRERRGPLTEDIPGRRRRSGERVWEFGTHYWHGKYGREREEEKIRGRLEYFVRPFSLNLGRTNVTVILCKFACAKLKNPFLLGKGPFRCKKTRETLQETKGKNQGRKNPLGFC